MDTTARNYIKHVFYDHFLLLIAFSLLLLFYLINYDTSSVGAAPYIAYSLFLSVARSVVHLLIGLLPFTHTQHAYFVIAVLDRERKEKADKPHSGLYRKILHDEPIPNYDSSLI